ncbi:hypothetical protein RHECNPAF_4460032 [Rhizobium etli CNPAF512]|nr:hypothetical protein RHECNPAF_4460032 [Rhizobium etli CNPAF512]
MPTAGSDKRLAEGLATVDSPFGTRLSSVSRGQSAFISSALHWENWSGRRDSNPRPQPWQGCALPLSYTRSIRIGPG